MILVDPFQLRISWDSAEILREGTMTSQMILFSLMYFRKLGAGGNDVEFDHGGACHLTTGTGVPVNRKDEAVAGVFLKARCSLVGKTPLCRGFR